MKHAFARGRQHAGTATAFSRAGTGLAAASIDTGYAMPQGHKRQSGFTLLELLVVMVIIGLLVGYVAPMYFKQVGKSEVKVARAQIESFGKALDQYRLDTGHYPTTEQGLAALTAKPTDEARWDGPYLKKGLPADPWGQQYTYKRPGAHGEYDIISFGKDGVPGGTGEDADLGSWE